MQPNLITLPVDRANNGNPIDEVYEKADTVGNRSTYHGPGHTLEERDKLDLYRTPPTKSGNFRGTAKSSFKFTEDRQVLTVDGLTTVAPLILEVSFSIPVGVNDLVVKEARQRAIALLDNDSVMDALNNRQII